MKSLHLDIRSRGSFVLLVRGGGDWRRIRVPGDMALDRLHRIIQLTFDGAGTEDYTFTLTGGAVVRAAVALADDDIRSRPAEGVLLSEAAQGGPITYEVGHGLRVSFTIDVESVDPPRTGPQTWCLAGSIPDVGAINAELDAERWVVDTLRHVPPGLAGLILRTGTWEWANLLALTGLKHPPQVNTAEAATMVAPYSTMLRAVAAGEPVAPDSLLRTAQALGLLDHREQLTSVGMAAVDDPLELWWHLTRTVPLERQGARLDAAWLLILELLGGLPPTAAALAEVEAMEWAGWRCPQGDVYTVDAIRQAAAMTRAVLEHLGFLREGAVVLGGPYAGARREFLRAIVQRES